MEATISDHPLGSVSRPDLVLSAIPGPVVLAAVLGVALGVPLPVALAVGSLPAGVVMGYALFWEPPVGGLGSSNDNGRPRETRGKS